MNISGGSTDNHLLTSLQNGVGYNISIVATSQHFFSNNVVQELTLGELQEIPKHQDY